MRKGTLYVSCYYSIVNKEESDLVLDPLSLLR